MISQRWLHVIVASLIITGAVTIARAQPEASPDTAAVETAILARLADVQDAAENLDPEKVFSYVLENDSGALAQRGRLFLTREEALQVTRQGFQGLAAVSYQLDEQHVTLLSPTIALVTGEGEVSVETEDGRTFGTRFAQSVVFLQTDGDWKVYHSHRSFPPSR